MKTSQSLKSLLGLVAVCFISQSLYAAEFLTITSEDGQPLAGVNVMIGNAPNEPFPDNNLKTDINGQLTIPDAWKDSQPVTLTLDGYRRATFLSIRPISQLFQLHREDVKAQIEIKGDTTNYPNLKKDGKVDVALVFPALRRRELIQFDVSSVISSEVDTMQVLTETLEIPSNISIPEQKETYVLPITLDKPVYRMFVRRPGTYRMTATHAQFPLKQVVNDIRGGKSFLDVMKHFRFFGGGQKDISVTNSISGQNIPVNQIPYNRIIQAQAPTGMPDNLAFIMFSMVDQAGLFFPADVKSVGVGETTPLYVPSGSSSNYIVTLTVDKKRFDATSQEEPTTETTKSGRAKIQVLTLVEEYLRDLQKTFDITFGVFDFKNPAASFATPQTESVLGSVSISLHPETVAEPLVLDLVTQPVRDGLTIRMNPPRNVDGIEALGTMLVLAEIEKAPKNDHRPDRSTRIWESYQSGWAREIQLPQLALDLDPAKTYSWEVLFLGKAINDKSTDGNYILDQVTHITRNSIEF
jgi:hypothetical protein